MRVTVITIVIGVLGTVPKGLELEQEEIEIWGRIETIQTTTLSRSLEYSEESWRPEDTYYYLVSRKNHQLRLVWKTRKEYHLIPARRPDLIIINKKKKKKTCKIVDFAVPADHTIKLKEYEKKDKYLDLARELKKLWNMQVTIIPIVIGAFETVTKGLQQGLEDLEVGGRVETIQTTALLRTAKIQR